jgi:hypothetical protein
MASIGVNYILGRTLAERQGVTDEAGKNVVSVMLMGLGLTPIGVLLARQIAIQRAEVTPAPAGTGAAGAASGAAGSGGTGGTSDAGGTAGKHPDKK